MAREITLENPVVLEVQPKIETTSSVIEFYNFIDDGGCVMATFKVGDKSYNGFVLWDVNTTPTYEEVGQYTDDDVDNRIKEIVLNS